MNVTVDALDDPGLAAALLDVSPEELVADDARLQPLARWIARSDGTPLGVATAFRRPDDRVFLVHRLRDESAFEPLTRSALVVIPGEFNLTIRANQPERRAVAERLGFTLDLESRSFDVPFASALATTGRLRRPLESVDLLRSDQVAHDEIYELDLVLRNDVPGNDGWRGRRDWFDDEMAAPEHDLAGYVVAREQHSDRLVGLCRCWRNVDGPALGLIAAVRQHRRGGLAIALLDEALRSAAAWGSPTFTTHTAHSSLQRRLRRLGATETGGFVRMRSTPPRAGSASGRT